MLKLNFLILFLLLPLHSHAFDSNIGDIYIESENLDIDIATKKAEFFDNVVVKQGDIKVSTDKLVIFFENNEMKKIDFLNNVKFQMRDKLILGDKAEYTKKCLSIRSSIQKTELQKSPFRRQGLKESAIKRSRVSSGRVTK